MSEYPCFACASDHQLDIILAILLCRILSTDADNECTVEQMVQDSRCFHCFSDRQIKQRIVALIATYAADNGLVTDVEQEIANAVCLNCVEPKQVRGMILDQIERGINNGTLFNPR